MCAIAQVDDVHVCDPFTHVHKWSVCAFPHTDLFLGVFGSQVCVVVVNLLVRCQGRDGHRQI